MLTIWQARKRIAEAASPIAEVQLLSLACASKRVLAADCVAAVDVPPADNSAMDGYAFAASSAAQASTLFISQTVAAGAMPEPLQPGTAARIFTGANIPAGADTVAMQENCDRLGDKVVLREPPVKNANIRPRGQDFVSGCLLARRGQVLDATTIALLAAGGVSEVKAVRAPRVAIINTGSELVEPGAPLRSGQIYNSNAAMLRTLLSGWGCDIVLQLHVPDNLEQTKDALRQASAQADLIITSGGVSVGDEDHVKTAIEALGQLQLWKVCMKPGKPLAFGHIAWPHDDTGATPLIGLPGNPVSSYVTTVLFVKAFIDGLYGRNYREPRALSAPAAFTVDGPQRRPEFVRVRVNEEGLDLYPNQSSGVLSSLAWADALAYIDPAELPIVVGDPVPFYLLEQLEKL